MNPSTSGSFLDPSVAGNLCRAIVKRTGQRCRNAPIHGATVCRMHGGRAPQVKAKAQQRVAESELRKFLAERGVVVSADPVKALTDLVGEVVAWYEFCRDYVAELQADKWETHDDKGGVQLTVYVEILERAQDRAHKLLADFMRLGMEERLLRLTERQASMISDVIDGVLSSLELSEETHAKARAELPRQLRRVAAA